MTGPRLDGAPVLPDGRPVFALSADDPQTLAAAAAQLHRYLVEYPQVPLADVAAALVGTRELRRHRAFLHTDDRAELFAALDALVAGHPAPGLHTGTAATGETAFVFPGQGSQRRGMGALFYHHSEAYRAEVDRIHEVSLALFGFSPRDYLLATGEWAVSQGSAPVDVVQPAIFMQALGLVAMWRATGLDPRIHLGHSQGEIAAAVAAGVVDLADGMRLVTNRAVAVRDNAPLGHSMAVLGTDRERCASMLARVVGFAELSVVNSAHVLCVSGEREVIVGLVEQATAEGIFAREIRVEYPAHTSLVGTMWHLRDVWMAGMDHQSFLPSDHRMIGGTLGEAVDGETDFPNYWFWNLRNPVRFDLATRAAVDAGATRLIEIAEHPTLQLALVENVSESGKTVAVTGTSRRDAPDLSVFAAAAADVLLAHAQDLDALRTGTTSLPVNFPAPPMGTSRLWASVRPGERPIGPVRPAVRTMETRWREVSEYLTEPSIPLAVIDPTGERAAVAEAIVAAAARYGAQARIADRVEPGEGAVLLAPVGPHDDPLDRVAGVLADRRWWSGERPGAALTVVTVGAVDAADGEVPDAVGTAIGVGVRAFAVDLPGLTVRHIDLDPGADAAAQAGSLVHALHLAGEPRIALRAGAILAERWTPIDEAVVDAGAQSDAAAAEHVVITGGTGHLGLAFAADAAARGARTVTLLSRSGSTPATRAALARIARRHRSTVVSVQRCDITDSEAVATVVDARTDLIVHTAVGYRHVPADQLTADQFAVAAEAKVLGLRVLAAAAPDAAIIACSSVAAALPGAGQAWYAAANALMEGEVARYRHAGRNAVAVRWGLWEQAGPLDADGFAAVTATGVVPMAAPDAMAGLARAAGPRPVILACDLPRLRAVVGAFGAAPLLAEIDDIDERVSELPGAPRHAAAEAAESGPGPATTGAAPAADAPVEGGRDVATVLRVHLARALAVTPETIDPNLALVSLGLDSLQALELRTAVRDELGAELSLESILGGASLAEVTASLGR